MRSRNQMVVPVLLATFVVLFSTAAYAGNFGPNSSYPDAVPYADNANHSRYYDAGHTSAARAATDWTSINSYNTTDMTFYYTTTDIHGSNDIWYTTDPLPGSLVEYASCRAMQDSDECEHWHGTFDQATMDSGSTTTTYRRAIACHCTGHTVGLADGPFRCMNDPVPTTDPYVGTHNVAHINGRW